MLAFFTDGLVERPRELIDDGVARLAATLDAGSAERSCASVIATFASGEDRRDDVALLVLRRDDIGAPLRFRANAQPASLRTLRRSLNRWLEWNDASEDDVQRIVLAVGEAATNAVEHAYGLAGGELSVEATHDRGSIVVKVRDNGAWREPRGENRGRGLKIIERCADEATVEKSTTGTTMKLRFTLSERCPT
jgi:anti-sigma regulatory factor (Ser/Thr protein kinase)